MINIIIICIFSVILILTFYLAKKFQLSMERIIALSIIPPILISLPIALLYSFYDTFALGSFIMSLLLIPIISYLILSPIFIVNATIMIYLEKYHYKSLKIFTLHGAIIGAISMIIYGMIVFQPFNNPQKILVFTAIASILGATASFILQYFINIGVINDH